MIIHIVGFISLNLKVIIFIRVNDMNPSANPALILYVRAIMIIIIKAGKASSMFLKLMFVISFIMNNPTIINAGAVA